MSQDLYRATVLEHSRHPQNTGRVAHPTHQARAANPLCGDELEVTLRLTGQHVEQVRVAVRGCVISQASASLMSVIVQGHRADEARRWAGQWRSALEGEADLPPDLESLRPLLELRNHRSRTGCALLAWVALERALGQT
ncbi:MAG: SUF system NifU family Fe-S cluster assembly protein [Candidatus Lambdaproteobacteria bacterium]|nr:SUF system NifU family Fe-S cluster assembly protein [Candidatus Lambdaproteobacteria bacterium]